MTNRERDAFHARRAYGFVRAAVRELSQISRLDSVRAKVLRELHTIEDLLWQVEPKDEREAR